MAIAAAILALTYLGIAFTRLPFVNIDRPAATLTGGVLMVLLGVLTFSQAIGAVDFNTLALLLGMMLLISVLQRAGFFTFLASRSIAFASTPWHLMVVVAVATAFFSAFLVNDAVVLLFTPVIIQAARMLGVNPIPYLVVEAMASNIGSTATIVGNPQNMLIGVTSGISFGRFFLYLLPVAVISTLVLLGMARFTYRGLWKRQASGPLSAHTLAITAGHPIPAREKQLRVRASAVLGLTVLGFFLSPVLGIGVPMVALTAGVLALLVGGVRPSQEIRSVDWVLLLFFGGLFVVIGGARQAGVLDIFIERVSVEPDLRGILSMHLYSALVSQVVSNVPLTMITIPIIERVPGHVLWVSLAAGSTLGGNATLIGAVANIIVAESAARDAVEVRFGDFLRLGLPVTAITLALSIGVLSLEYLLGLLR